MTNKKSNLPVPTDGKIVKYDNSFNKTSLNVLTEVQSDILMAVLNRMGKEVRKDIHGNDCYVAKYEFNEIRDMIDSKFIQAKRIKKVFDDLLDTKVEFHADGVYTKANLFSHYSLTDKSTAEIVLSSELTKKLITGKERYTILVLDEYVGLKNKYSKELYRLLRQFRHTGMLIIKKEDLIKALNPPKSYDEYNFIKKVLEPAIKNNDQYFNNLKIINITGVGSKLPNVCKLAFVKHEKRDLKKAFAGKSEEEVELLKYIMENTGE